MASSVIEKRGDLNLIDPLRRTVAPQPQTGGGRVPTGTPKTIAPSPFETGGGPVGHGTHSAEAAALPQPEPEGAIVLTTPIHVVSLPAGERGESAGPPTHGDQNRGVPFSLLYQLQRDREDAVNEERSLTLRMKARLRMLASLDCPDHKPKCKRCVDLANAWHSGKGDPQAVTVAALHNEWLHRAQAPVTAYKRDVERQMTAIAKASPMAPFVERTLGLGYLGMAQILAEAGDLSNYANPGKLWKRFGLAVIDGGAQRRVSGEEAALHGFAPKRRAVMFCIGDALIKKQGEYRALYLERKAYEIALHPDLPPIRHHRRAQRYMEKRLLREIWREWRTAK